MSEREKGGELVSSNGRALVRHLPKQNGNSPACVLCVVAGHFLVEKPWEIPSLFQRCDLRRYGTAVDDFFVFY
jgi:hypothetical protein